MASHGIHGAVDTYDSLPDAAVLDLGTTFLVRQDQDAPSGAGLYWVRKSGGSRAWVLLDGLSLQNASEVPYSNGTSGLASEDVQGAIDEIASGAGGTGSKAESFYKGEMAHTDRQMEQRNRALGERIIEREQAAGDRRNERDEAYMTDLQASEAALQQAQQEWKDAAAEAARKRDATTKGPEESDPPDMSDALAGLKDKLAQAGKATVDAADRAVSVSGTFNASSLLGLQTGSAADRTARATEETATNTRKLLDESKHGGLTFG